MPRHGEDILVAAAAHVHHQQVVLGSVGASFLTHASACDGSSAGMMPSSLVHIWKASSASLSVAGT